MKYILTLSLLLSSILGFAKNGANVTGQLSDQQGKPLEFATVMLMKAADSSLVKGGITDEQGKFLLEGLVAGNYFLKASFVGYADYFGTNFSLSDNQAMDLGSLKMKEAGQTLAEATVVARKPLIEVEADKTIFNVENQINTAGQNALELLRKAPGVTVDKDDNLSLKGKSGVRVYINGKQSQMTQEQLANLLKSMQASDIEAFELISNPSAKYDASGNAGIINIRLKRNKKTGFNGTASAQFMYGYTPKGTGSLSLNYMNGPWSITSNYSATGGTWRNFQNLRREQDGMIYDMTSTSNNTSLNHNFNLGVDYSINKKHTIGVGIFGNTNNDTWTNDGRTRISTSARRDSIMEILIAKNTMPNSNVNFNSNINYRYQDTSGRTFGVDADYGFYNSKSVSDQPNSYVSPSNENLIFRQNNYANNTPINITFYTLKADWEQPFLKGKLGFGAKGTYVQTDNTFQFWNVNAMTGERILDLDKTNQFLYTENVNAAYVNYNKKINKKWSAQVGLRLEQTNSKGDLRAARIGADAVVERSYLDLFPSGSLTYTPSDKHALALTYSRRIDRPTYQNLNPFEMKLDELTYNKGNAFLQPQYGNSIELTHTFMQFFNTSVGYNRLDGVFAEIMDTLSGGRTVVTSRNLAYQEMYSVNISSPIPVNKWYNIYFNLNLYRQRSVANFGEGKTIDLSVNNANVYMQHNFVLPKDWGIEVSGWATSPGIWMGQFQYGTQGSLDLGASKKFWDKKANLRVSVTDVLFTTPWYGFVRYGGLRTDGRGGWESRQVRVSLTYNFGKGQTQQRKRSGSDAERDRIKSGR